MRAATPVFALSLLAAAAALVPSAAIAQQSPDGSRNSSLTIPGEAGIVQLSAHAPAEVRVGQPYDFTIQVKNISEQIAVHDLVIAQHASGKVEVQSSKIQGGPQDREQQDRQSQPQDQKSQPQDKSGQSKQASKEQSGESGQAQDPSSDSPQKQSGQGRWTIKRLNPGETRTISVTAVSDEEGESGICLLVESYKPSLCLATKITKPELAIAKQVPKTADFCHDIEVAYFVKNEGSGDLAKFTVEDQLPEGLQTIDGDKSLKFTLDDGLKAGDVRKFVATLRATKAGEFSSRASVQGPEGLSAQSNKTTIQVLKPQLAVAIEGPATREVDSLANYTIRVSNLGDTEAPNAQLTLFAPRSADIVQASEPRPSSRTVQQSSQSSAGRTEEGKEKEKEKEANAQASSSTEKSQSQGEKSQSQGEKESRQPQANQASGQQQKQPTARKQWSLGDLQPGETVEVNYSLRLFEGGQLRQVALAQYVCPAAQKRKMDMAQFRAQASDVTQIIALPGLRLTVIDNKDPVPTGETVTYTIQVANEGDAKAENIEVTAELPPELQFVSIEGETKGKHSQQQVSLEPVPALTPGEEASWKLVAKVSQQADAAIKVEMKSADFDRAVTAEEPTTLFDGEQSAEGNETSSKSGNKAATDQGQQDKAKSGKSKQDDSDQKSGGQQGRKKKES